MRLFRKTCGFVGIALALSAAGAASAATIYNDVDPDVVVSNGFEYLDATDDGLADFFLSDQYFSTTSEYGGAQGGFGTVGAVGSFYQVASVLVDIGGWAIDVGAGTNVDGSTAATFGGVWTGGTGNFFDTSVLRLT